MFSPRMGEYGQRPGGGYDNSRNKLPSKVLCHAERQREHPQRIWIAMLDRLAQNDTVLQAVKKTGGARFKNKNQNDYSTQIVARLALSAEPTGMVTWFVRVTETVFPSAFKDTAVTIAPSAWDTLILSCFAVSNALYAPSTYDADA